MTTLTTTSEQILAQGGLTWSPYTSAPEAGYMVAREDAEATFPVSSFSEADVAAYAEAHPLAADEFYGAWVHGGRVYLDVSRNFADLGTALDAARTARQLAIWDVAHSREIAA